MYKRGCQKVIFFLSGPNFPFDCSFFNFGSTKFPSNFLSWNIKRDFGFRQNGLQRRRMGSKEIFHVKITKKILIKLTDRFHHK